MPKRYMDTQEAEIYTGKSNDWIRQRLDYVTDDKGEYLKHGRRHLYHLEDVKQIKRELDAERRFERKRVLRPEQVSKNRREEVKKDTFVYQVLGKMISLLTEKKGKYGDRIKKFMRGKTDYPAGGNVVKSISHYHKTEYEVSKDIFNIFSLDDLLSQRDLAEIKIDPRALLTQGVTFFKDEKLKPACEEFKEFCSERRLDIHSMKNEDLKKVASKFFRKYSSGHNLKIKFEHFFPMVRDMKYKRLGEKKMGWHALKIVKSYITETLTPQYLRVTLEGKHEELAEETGGNYIEGLDFSKLHELSEKLPTD